MSGCRAWRTHLVDAVAGELAGERLTAFERHLETCALCRAELETLRETAALAARTLPAAPPRDPERLWRRLERELDAVDRRRAGPSGWLAPVLRPAGAALAAAALAALVIAALVVLDRAPGGPTPDGVIAAAPDRARVAPGVPPGPAPDAVAGPDESPSPPRAPGGPAPDAVAPDEGSRAPSAPGPAPDVVAAATPDDPPRAGRAPRAPAGPAPDVVAAATLDDRPSPPPVPVGPSPDAVAEPARPRTPANGAAAAELRQYLRRSKPLVLALANRGAGTGDAAAAERRLARELAREATKLEPASARERRLVEDLERVFLQLANLPAGEYRDGVDLLRASLDLDVLLFRLAVEALHDGGAPLDGAEA